MEDIKQKIVLIITHTHKTPFEQADEILLLFNVSKTIQPVCENTVCGFIQGSCRYEDNVGYCQAPPHIKCKDKGITMY